MKRCMYLICLVTLLFSCETKEKFTGEIHIYFAENDPDKKLNKELITTRLERLNIQKYTVKELTNGFAIELPRVADTLLLVKMMKFDDQLGFWETYENTEVFPWLEKLNNLLATNMQADSTQDSTTKKHPLFSKLQMNMYKDNQGNMYLTKGCIIGLAAEKDTADVNKMLKLGYTYYLFPKQMICMWGEVQAQGAIPLYALKADEFTQAPFMENGAVKTSRLKKNKDLGNQSLVLTLTDEGGRKFKTMTAKNIGKEIAISFGSHVLIHPIVEHEIKDGLIEITGPGIEVLQSLEQALTMPLYTTHPTLVTHHFTLRK
jgi:SecD/SecF fusion protein